MANGTDTAIAPSLPAGYQVEQQSATPAPSSLPAGYSVEQSGQPSQQFGDQPGQKQDVVSNVESGFDEAGGDISHAIVNAPKNILSSIWHALPPVALHDSFKQVLPVIDAYEKSRSSGAGVMDSLKAANDQAAKQNAVKQQVEAAAKAFKENPTRETARGVMDATAFVASLFGGGEGAAPAEATAEGSAETGAATEAATQAATQTATKPGLLKQVIKGKEVAQPAAKGALSDAATAAAKDTGVGATVQPQGVRSLLDDTIAQSATKERGLYDAVNKAAGTDMKSLYDRAEELKDALDDPTNIANRSALQTELDATNTHISQGEASATKNLVNAPKAIQEAKQATQQRYSLQEVKSKLFNNEGVVSGNIEHGAAETINTDSAIKAAERLNKPSRFAPEGTPTRLEQALGQDGASKLLKNLYSAQKTGQTALKVQTIGRWLAGVAGVGGGTELVKHVASAVSNK
jgi:hypothetical protein